MMAPMTDPQRASASKRSFQAPKGTRDFYPQEMLRRRYITDTWRRVSLRHGFEEIDGPTFEHLDLYTVKSGEGIVSELFSFQRAGGDDTYALRPEFTPTLARMYAARAKQLPQPTKWFCIPNFFRAERPQRGRLREFFQWNCDILGGDSPAYDAELVAVCVEGLWDLGLNPQDARAHFNDRRAIEHQFDCFEIPHDARTSALSIVDGGKKRNQAETRELIAKLALSPRASEGIFGIATGLYGHNAGPSPVENLNEASRLASQVLDTFADSMEAIALGGWCQNDVTIVRGLAYYTGMVFEVIAEGERAVAGGGRYDNLIELFGGPPTPACGFGMGDVVLGNLLEDRGLIPEGRDLLEALAKPMPLRPDVFVISSGKEGADDALTPLVAELRRGVESERYTQSQASDDAAKRMKPWDGARYDVAPRHARRSYKATKNVGKLLGDAGACHARFAVILESAEKCMLKNLDSGEQREVGIEDVGREVGLALR